MLTLRAVKKSDYKLHWARTLCGSSVSTAPHPKTLPSLCGNVPFTIEKNPLILGAAQSKPVLSGGQLQRTQVDVHTQIIREA